MIVLMRNKGNNTYGMREETAAASVPRNRKISKKGQKREKKGRGGQGGGLTKKMKKGTNK